MLIDIVLIIAGVAMVLYGADRLTEEPPLWLVV